MARPFAFNTGSLISGTTQVGDIAIGVDNLNYSQGAGGVRWWNGPDETLGYVVCGPNSGNTQPTPEVPTEFASVQFWRSSVKTDSSFIQLAEYLSNFTQTFTAGTEANEWLNENGFWSSYFQYIVSAGRTTTGGFQVGAFIDKDMYNQFFNYQAQGMPNNTSQNLNASVWDDWGGDIFDNWGYFYLYDPTANNYLGLVFNNINLPDGQFSTQNFNFNGRTFSITQGYPVQGIFKFEIRVNDDLPFVFGEAGNMGSDSSTSNQDLTYSYNLDGVDLTLWYNHNFQVGNPPEQFYSYYIPFLVDENVNKTYTDVMLGSDNLYLYSVPCTRGLTVYHSKQFDVKEWVVYDLTFGE